MHKEKYCQYLHRDVGDEYDSYVSSRSSDRDHCSASPCQNNETEENKNLITTAAVARSIKSYLESTFDYGLLDISEDSVEEVKEKTSVGSKKQLQCEHCSYKCKYKNSLQKHMNTKHGLKQM